MELFCLPGADAPHVYVRAWTLCCFHSLISTQTFPGADSIGGQLREEKECPFSGVTYSGRVWRKVSESDARSVSTTATPAEVLSTEASMSSHLVSGPRQQDWIKVLVLSQYIVARHGQGPYV